MPSSVLRLAMDSLFTRRISFVGGKGAEITLDAVYQDTHPEGNARATIIAQHGAPGSHKDFKYITPGLVEKNIRVVGVNHPGHGFTSHHPLLNSSNEERNNYVRALVRELELDGQPVIFMGHSRGAENSLQLGVRESCLAVVLLNPPPTVKTPLFRRKIFLIKLCSRLNRHRWTRAGVQRVLQFFYNNVVKLRVPSGEVAAVTMESIPTLAFEEQTKYVEQIASNDKVRLLYAYSASDHLISKQDYEKAESLLGEERKRLVYPRDPADEEENLSIGREIASHFEDGHRIVTALFETNDHHLNKWRAPCVVEAIDGIVRWHERTASNKD